MSSHTAVTERPHLPTTRSIDLVKDVARLVYCDKAIVETATMGHIEPAIMEGLNPNWFAFARSAVDD